VTTLPTMSPCESQPADTSLLHDGVGLCAAPHTSNTAMNFWVANEG
jgi:hypothetical protein